MGTAWEKSRVGETSRGADYNSCPGRGAVVDSPGFVEPKSTGGDGTCRAPAVQEV